MADVFISYKREERQAVERLAHELRQLGLEVWFDASLNAGEAFSDEIDREAHAAKAILVCWSPTARESQWVKSEALIGFEQRKLAACYVAGPDGFYAPTPFNSIHAEDLRAWVSAPTNTHAGYKSILRRVGALCGRADIESYGALDVQAPASTLRAWLERHQSSSLFMAVDELLHVRDAEEAERTRLEREARERRAREEAERRERDEAERKDREAERRADREQDLLPAHEGPNLKGGGARYLAIAVVVAFAALTGGSYWYLTQSQSTEATSVSWQAVDTSSADSIRDFLSGDPGAYRDDAQQALAQLEERTYEAARDIDSIEALEGFLNDFPESEHAIAARGRIAELQALQPPP